MIFRWLNKVKIKMLIVKLGLLVPDIDKSFNFTYTYPFLEKCQNIKMLYHFAMGRLEWNQQSYLQLIKIIKFKMDDNVPHVSNIQTYHDHFRKTAQTVKFEPRRDRNCNDKLCYALFVLITVAFLAIGYYFIRASDIRQIFKSLIRQNQYSQYTKYVSQLQGYNIENLKPAIPVIAGMMGLSIIMAVVFLCLLVRFPKCVFIFMMVLGVLLLIAITALLFYVRAFAAAIILCVLIIALVGVLFCTFPKLKTGLILLNIASKFLSERPSVFVAPVFVLIFIVVFQCFWAMALAGITIYKGSAQNEAQIADRQHKNSIIGFFWGFFNLFYSFFFYYCICFLIATAAGIWYYRSQQNYLIRGTGRIVRYHIGSFTFASLLVSIVSLIRQYSERQAHQSGVGASTFCILLLGCCIKCTQNLLQTLNHNSIITMSVTGQSYFDSAKSTLSLIFDNFPLFFIVDMMSHLVTIAGIVFICGIPGILGFFLLRATAENPDDTTSQAVGTIIIVLFGMLVGAVFLSTLSQSLSCMFIFFCLDKKFVQMGYDAPNRAPEGIKKIFHQLTPYVGGQYNEHYDSVYQANQNNQNASQVRPAHFNYRNDEPENYNNRNPEFY